MAQEKENAGSQLTEQLFQAIDTITTKRLEGVKFDKTITCKIIDVSNSDKGEYIVSDTTSDFIAYSENDSYSEGTWVYVSIPNGDFNEQKHIVGKYIADNTEYSTYKNPLDSYIDITGNLYDGENETLGLIANNNAESEIVIWQIGEMSNSPYASSVETKEQYLENIRQAIEKTETSYQNAKVYYDSQKTAGVIDEDEYELLIAELEVARQEKINDLIEDQEDASASYRGQQLSSFNRLGIQASFKTFLHNYSLESGQYGLRLYIKTSNYQAVGTSSNDNYIIIELKSDDMFGNPYNFITWSQQQYVFDISMIDNIVGMKLVFYQNNNFRDNTGTFIPGYPVYKEDHITFTDEWKAYTAMKNILIKDIYISLGYDLNLFENDGLMLYTYDSLTYTSVLSDNDKKILEKDFDASLNLNNEQDTLKGLNYLNNKTIYLRWVHKDSDTGITEAIDDIEDIDTWEDEENEYSLAKVHWYHWKMEDGITSELAGAFWEELNLNDLQARAEAPEDTDWANWVEVPNTYDWFEYENVIPNVQSPSERYRVVIEYPCKEYLEQAASESIEEYINANESAWSTEIINNLFTEEEQQDDDFPNFEQQAAVQIEYKKRIKSETENYNANLLGQRGLYYSPEIEFTNEQDVPDQTSIEVVQALQLVCDSAADNGLEGTYNIYNSDGQIMNIGETRNRIITAKFNTVITGQAELDKAEIIRWYIPGYNTMIETPVEGNEYVLYQDPGTLAEDATQEEIDAYNRKLQNNNESICAISAGWTDDSHQWFCIERQGVEHSDRAKGAIIPNSLEQIFRIKSQYNQTAMNNTIRCEVYKNNKTYTAECTLYFGISGSNGTDYTLVAHLEEEIDNKWVPVTTPAVDWHGGRLKLVPQVLDYNHKDITNQFGSNSFSYTLLSGGGGFTGLTGPQTKDENGALIFSRSDSDIKTQFYHYVIEISLVQGINVTAQRIDGSGTSSNFNVKLTTQYPIAVRFNNNYVNMTGGNRVTYDSSGTNPTYHKSPYELYNLDDQGRPIKTEGLRWTVQLAEGNSPELNPYYPQIDIASGMLVVPAMYMSGNPQGVSIIADKDDEVVWCQPLYISQEVYASTFLNSWDGSLSVDEQNGTIMSAMVGAGYKNPNNTFSGVLMGNVSHTTGIGSQTGLFGYLQGEQSFGFNIDGTAFLGRSGRGRINFDGNGGTIKSGAWDSDSTASGMYINLDNGFLNIRGVETEFGQARVQMNSNGNDYFSIINQSDKYLMQFSDDAQYIQSSNFSNSDRTGLNFNLSNGTLTGYNFDIKSYNTADPDSQFIRINSNDDLYPLRIGNNFQVSWDGVVRAFSFRGYDNTHIQPRVLIDGEGLTVYNGQGTTYPDNVQARLGQILLLRQTNQNFFAIDGSNITLQHSKGIFTIDSNGINISSSDTTGTRAITIGQNPSRSLLIRTSVIVNINLAPNKAQTFSASTSSIENNAVILGVIGYNINQNADNGGTSGISLLNVYECYYSSTNHCVYVAVRNLSQQSSRKKNQVVVYLLITPISTQWEGTVPPEGESGQAEEDFIDHDDEDDNNG